ncbi:hypothetical protein M2140_002008 [Clostridiales Family XIII bacterium PM5-7]
MQKSISVNCPTYLELELKNGTVNAVNGKELTNEGVRHVIEFLCQEVNVKADDVLTKARALCASDGQVTLKLHNGAVTTL